MRGNDAIWNSNVVGGVRMPRGRMSPRGMSPHYRKNQPERSGRTYFSEFVHVDVQDMSLNLGCGLPLQSGTTAGAAPVPGFVIDNAGKAKEGTEPGTLFQHSSP
jgi:hypothetical protein